VVGSHSFAVRAVDGAGNVDPTPASRVWVVQPASSDTSGGLLVNGSFEGSTAGWWAANAVASVVAGGQVGASAARVSWTAGDRFVFVAGSPVPVASAVAAQYSLSGWVRSETPGLLVCLRLREWDGAVFVRQAQECVAASGSWQQWPVVSLTPAAGHQLDVMTMGWDAHAGDSYDLDGLVLTGG
jgi:hypothetical protein